MTVSTELLTPALIDIGFCAAGETPSTADRDAAFSWLNDMIDQWSAEKRFAYEIVAASYAWGASKQSYTIGPVGADFTAERPTKLEDYCNLIIVGSPDIRRPLPLITTERYAAIGIPALSSTFPTKVYYEPTFPNGTLWPWPYPTTVTNKIELFTWKQITQFAAVTDAVAFPPGYKMAVRLSLEELLCNPFGRPIPPDLPDRARNARSVITSLNREEITQETDIPRSRRAGGMQWDPSIRGWR